MQRTFSPCYIPDMHWKQMSAPYPVNSCHILDVKLLGALTHCPGSSSQGQKMYTLHHVTSRYHPATLNCWTIVLSSSYTVYTLFIPFHSLPCCRLGRPKVTLSSYSWWFVGSLDCFILLLHLQPRTMRKNDAPKISKMMRYHASKIFKFGSQISRQIQAASTDINELDVGKPDNELEGNGLEDEKSSSDEFSFLTEICTELSKQNS